MNIQNALTFIFCSLCLVGCNTVSTKSTPEMVTSFADPLDVEVKQAILRPDQNSRSLVSLKTHSHVTEMVGEAWLFPYKLEAQTPLIFRDVLTSYHIPTAAELEKTLAEETKEATQLAEIERNKPVKIEVSIRGSKQKQSRGKKGKNENLWVHLSDGYSLTHISHPRIDAAIERYTTKYPRYFSKISRQAKPYLYHIVQEIEKRGLPLELALLPAIESAYEPSAHSHMEAAGIWQFTPGTAKHFGLRQDLWYDERRDIMTSTDAALDYLKYLHDFFDGDWLLAIGAYNCGEGNMRKAVRRNQREGKPTDFWSLDLPQETKDFVPKILAAARVVANPKQYGVNINYIPNEPYLQTVEIDKQIDLVVAAKFAGLSTYEFKRLNPGYRRRVTGPDAPFQLALPISKVANFKNKLKKVTMKDLMPNPELAALEFKPTKHAAVEIADSQPKKKYTHVVRSGDSLWEIARKYRVRISHLVRWNNISKANKIKLGQKLTIWQDS